MTAGSLMAAEIAEQPGVLGRLAARHTADRDQVRAMLPGRLRSGRLAGTVLLARGSSDNVAVYGRYLIELASRRPAGLAAPSVHTRYDADVDYSGYLAVAVSQSGATPEIVEMAAHMRRAGAVVIAITNEPGSPLTRACDLTLLTEAGPELAVPATKTVTAQMLAIAAIAAAYDPVLVSPADEAALAARLTAEQVPYASCGSVPGAGLPLPPGVPEVTAPILATIRGQQLALAAALLRGLDPDDPAGLSKVTATHSGYRWVRRPAAAPASRRTSSGVSRRPGSGRGRCAGHAGPRSGRARRAR